MSSVIGMFLRLMQLFVDSGYKGKWVDWVKQTLGWTVEVVQHTYTGIRGIIYLKLKNSRLSRLPCSEGNAASRSCREVVERTFAWIGRFRRHSKDYEYLPESSETLSYATMIRLMSTRLAKYPL